MLLFLVAKSCPTLVTPWIVAIQAPLFLGFPRQEYWSGVPFPTPGDLPYPGMEPVSLVFPALAGRFFATGATLGSWGRKNDDKKAGLVSQVLFLSAKHMKQTRTTSTITIAFISLRTFDA